MLRRDKGFGQRIINFRRCLIYNVLSADLTDTNARLPMKSQDTKVLAMGVSDAVGNFPPLNDVVEEINNIVRSSNVVVP